MAIPAQGMQRLKAMGQTHLLRFLVVGGISTVINYAVFYVLFLWTGIGDKPASAAGFLTGVAVGYLFNKSWTFRHEGPTSFTLVGKYLLVYLASLMMSLGLLYVLVDLGGMDARIANVLCILFTTCTNFAGTKLVVFR